VSSMSFPKEILRAKEYLENNNHFVSIPPNTHECLEGKAVATGLDYRIKHKLLRKCFERIKDHDAILVLNHEKNGTKGYVGSASLMEIGVAFFLKKKVFLLNDLPSVDIMKSTDEILQTKPIILKGNLDLI